MDGKFRLLSIALTASSITFAANLDVASATNSSMVPINLIMDTMYQEEQMRKEANEVNSMVTNITLSQLPAGSDQSNDKSNITQQLSISSSNISKHNNHEITQEQSKNVTSAAKASGGNTTTQQNKAHESQSDIHKRDWQQYLRNRKPKRQLESRPLDENNPELEIDTFDPEPDKNTWDGQVIKYPTATDSRKRFRSKSFNWWDPTYERKLEDYQEKFLKYGYKGEGFRAGNYYTKYISPNPKFYTTDKFYGTKIYTPFWNHMRNKYQQVDCGVDCEYLGPKDYLGNIFIYIILFAAFIIVASLALFSKQKYDQERQIERAREFGQNVLQL